EGFQAKLDELFPPPVEKAEKAEKADASPKKADASQKGEKPEEAESDLPPEARALLGDTVNKLSNPASNSSFGRAKGIVFLVDAKSKQVIWSSYDLPKDSSSNELDRSASVLVNRIKRDMSAKKK